MAGTSQAQTAPYGSWKSPITAASVAAQSLRLDQIVVDGWDVYWIEMRPSEGGRSVVVRRAPDGTISDVTPAPFNARTRVHEYGGGAFTAADGTVYFSNFVDQRVYRQEAGGTPVAITADLPVRFADYVVDRRRRRLLCVREDHRVAADGGHEPINSLVAVAVEPAGEPDAARTLVSGNDFYASPRLSPDGSRLAWLTWNHPNMPWDGTELWVGEIDEHGEIAGPRRVAGGAQESIFQPEWSPDGVLHFVSDHTGWWNLYRLRERDGESTVEHLYEMDVEFGRPQWVFGLSTYDFISAEEILCAYAQEGMWRLGRLKTAARTLDPVHAPYSEIGRYVRVVDGAHGSAHRAVFDAGSPVEPASILQLNLATGSLEFLRRASEQAIDPGYLSTPEPIEFPTEQGLTAYGLFYSPHNRDFVAPAGERPPLIVHSHGGPTSSARISLQLDVQFWTSRGIALLDVNYGGSTGYGRAYWQRLTGRWGIVDVDDCVNGARYLVDRGLVDGNRLAISGGSAGGYTTLCALTFRNVFRVGASYYGVSDLEALAKDTHKFELRYLDSLIGPYPERAGLYRERSPIHFVDRLSSPVIFFQGLEDKVVPPDQAERMVEALRAKGVPVAYIPFEGEQHGFRRAENIARALEAELSFYGNVFGFEPADPIEPVPIDNL